MLLQEESNTLKVLHFLLQKTHLCIPLEYIVKVLPLTTLKYIPDSAPYCAGLMNISGKSIPIIDLAIYLHLKRTEKYTLATPIILCQNENHEVGIIIDEILDLVEINTKTLQLKNNFKEKESPFTGVVTINSDLVLILNIQQIISTNLISDVSNTHFDINKIHLTGFKHE